MKRSDNHRRNKTGVYLTSALVLVLAAGGGYFYYQKTQEEQVVSAGEKTIQQFTERLSTGDYKRRCHTRKLIHRLRRQFLKKKLLKNTKTFTELWP